MGTRQPIRLTMNGDGTGALQIGDSDLTNVAQRVDLQFEAGRPADVTVHLTTAVGEAAGEATIRLPDETHEALIALGWTPPQA